MEENKYYTPSIEEFHVGFELEIKTHELRPWEKHTWLPGDQAKSVSNYLDQIRVKYLDKEDLIELGFEYMEDVGDCINFAKYIQESNQSINLTLHRNSRRVGVAVHDLNVKPPMTSIQIGTFGGEIKNKSELIKVLKMLGIK